MKRITYGRSAVTLAVAAMLLAACGGGGDGDDIESRGPQDPAIAGTEVPTSATTSSAGALAFVKSVAATSSNTADPIVVGNAVLATSDTDEPDQGV
jgi:hypothetical protein